MTAVYTEQIESDEERACVIFGHMPLADYNEGYVWRGTVCERCGKRL